MHTTNLRKVGGSVMLAVPPAILEMLHLQAGIVGVSVNGGRLVIEPRAARTTRWLNCWLHLTIPSRNHPKSENGLMCPLLVVN